MDELDKKLWLAEQAICFCRIVNVLNFHFHRTQAGICPVANIVNNFVGMILYAVLFINGDGGFGNNGRVYFPYPAVNVQQGRGLTDNTVCNKSVPERTVI